MSTKFQFPFNFLPQVFTWNVDFQSTAFGPWLKNAATHFHFIDFTPFLNTNAPVTLFNLHWTWQNTCTFSIVSSCQTTDVEGLWSNRIKLTHFKQFNNIRNTYKSYTHKTSELATNNLLLTTESYWQFFSHTSPTIICQKLWSTIMLATNIGNLSYTNKIIRNHCSILSIRSATSRNQGGDHRQPVGKMHAHMLRY